MKHAIMGIGKCTYIKNIYEGVYKIIQPPFPIAILLRLTSVFMYMLMYTINKKTFKFAQHLMRVALLYGCANGLKLALFCKAYFRLIFLGTENSEATIFLVNPY